MPPIMQWAIHDRQATVRAVACRSWIAAPPSRARRQSPIRNDEDSNMGSAANGAGYSLVNEEDESDFWGYAQDARGLFVPLEDGLRRVELLGCAPEGGLAARLPHIGGRRARAGNAYLGLLAPSGAEIGSYFVNWLTPESVKPSGLGRDLVDLMVSLWCDDLLPESDRPWELIRTGRLDRTGLWQPLDPPGRLAWLSVALRHHAHRDLSDRAAGATFTLDGRYVVDEDSFYCALGEAVNGPGGYFGWNLDALDDCLRGRWGATPPFTLRWQHSESAASHLSRIGMEDDGRTSLLDRILDVLRERRIDVLMC